MKNIHIIQTDKPSRLYKSEGTNELEILSNYSVSNEGNGRNIYITSDVEIKEGDWFIDEFGITKNDTYLRFIGKKIILTTDLELQKDGVQAIDDEFLEWFVKNPNCEEVEANKSYSGTYYIAFPYKIIIPKEEPEQHIELINDNIEEFDKSIELFKQKTLEEKLDKIVSKEPSKFWKESDERFENKETLEKAAERLYPIILEDDGWDKNKQYRDERLEGAKYQQERSYSELVDLLERLKPIYKEDSDLHEKYDKQRLNLIEQFKKK